jgi:hypothetical protein
MRPPDRPTLCQAGPGSGLPAVVAEQLRTINRELDQLSDAGLAIACHYLVDILDSALVPAQERASFDASRLIELQEHIEGNLYDPRLCTSTIAAAQGISVRTLQQVPRPSYDARRAIHAATCARELNPSLARIRSTWPSAVRLEMTSRSAISRLDRPLSISSATSSSRLVNGAP